MKRHERQILLHYLRNIFEETPDPNSPSGLIRIILTHSQEFLGYDLREIGVSKATGFDECERLQMIGAALHGKLIYKNQVKPAPTDLANIQDETFDPTITSLCDTFDVPKEYRPLLQALIYSAKIPRLRRIINCFSNCGPREVIDPNDAEFFARMCGMTTRDVEMAIAPNSPLVNSGILRIDYCDRAFSNNFTKLLNFEFRSVEDVIRQMIGAPLESDLAKTNFDYMSDDLSAATAIVQDAIRNKTRGINILLYGAPGVGKTELAKIIATCARAHLYISPNTRTEKDERLPGLAQLQCALKREKRAVILFDEAEDVYSIPRHTRFAPSKLYINKCLENNQKPVIWVTNNICDMDPAHIRRFSLAIPVKQPDSRAKITAWRKIFAKHHAKISDEKLNDLARKYNVTLSVIDTAVKNMKRTGREDLLEYTLKNLSQAISGRPMRPTPTKAAPFSTHLLNTDTDLRTLAERIRDKGLRQFSMCLYGAPGTGKTAFADYLGEMMDMPVIKKRASDLLGMYVGESEKNIARAFADARARDAILVFDEADSFLRNREGAHHSWEISAVNEMLTQMEADDVPFICTTNLMNTLDPASLRRFLFKVKYDFLTPTQIANAFHHFFGHTPTTESLRGLNRISPGDFAVVRRRADAMDVTDDTTIIEMLRQEQSAKGGPRNSIGF